LAKKDDEQPTLAGELFGEPYEGAIADAMRAAADNPGSMVQVPLERKAVKFFECCYCGAFSRTGWVDLMCPACSSLATLIKRNPDFFDFINRADLEAKVNELFEQLLVQSGSAAARAGIKARGGNDWTVWYFDRWLAEREGRELPAEPSLFGALRNNGWRERTCVTAAVEASLQCLKA
jgi:hypothetical protein